MELDFRKMVSVSDGEPITDSKIVAKVFGKRHADVIRAVENIDCSDEFRLRNFALVMESMTYNNSAGKEVVKETKRTGLVSMTKDGFMFLVMGFTGQKAAKFKEAFIKAFNWMYDQIKLFNQNKDDDLSKINELDKESLARGSIAGRLLKERQDEKKLYQIERSRIEMRQLSLFNERLSA